MPRQEPEPIWQTHLPVAGLCRSRRHAEAGVGARGRSRSPSARRCPLSSPSETSGRVALQLADAIMDDPSRCERRLDADVASDLARGNVTECDEYFASKALGETFTCGCTSSRWRNMPAVQSAPVRFEHKGAQQKTPPVRGFFARDGESVARLVHAGPGLAAAEHAAKGAALDAQACRSLSARSWNHRCCRCSDRESGRSI